MKAQYIDYLPGKSIKDFSSQSQISSHIKSLKGKERFQMVKDSIKIIKYKVLPSRTDGVVLCIDYEFSL